jgi:ABC-type multidrug transport system fused ATPase/permease subunit
MDVSLTRHGNLLVEYLRPQRLKVALLSVLLFGGIGLELLNPQIVRSFIDTATTGGAVEQLTRAAILFIGVALIQQLVTVAATYVSQSVGWDATNALRADLLAHCLGLDMSFHKARTPGELIERVDGDVTALAQFFSQFVILVLGNSLLLVGVIVLLFREDWRAGAAMAIFALFALWVLGRSRNFAVPHATAERQASAELFGFIEERLAGMDDIRANGAGGHVMQGFYKVERVRFRKARRATVQTTMLWALTIALFAFGYALALGLGAYLYQAGAITLGAVYLFFQYTNMLRRPLEQLADQLKELQKASAGIRRIAELARLRPTIRDGEGAAAREGALEVAFERVSFDYDDEGPAARSAEPVTEGQRPPTNHQNIGSGRFGPSPLALGVSSAAVLHDITFTLAPGRVLGLLGRTGSGKTTLTRLLFRLYDPVAGAIRLGGADLRAIRLDDLRARVGIVTQDVQLFQATIRDNLTLFDTRIPDERIVATLGELGLLPWLQALSNGLDTELGPNGGGLSAGESQLLAFARVFLQDPGLVVMDEASSRLDPATERLLERAVDKLMTGRTGIIIAHRLATVQRADEIMILERGRVVEHDERERLARDPDSRFATLLRVGMEEVLA